MGRRRFAKNPEEVRHFRLVARSQNDPRADDPGAPPLVLEPFATPGAQRRSGLSEAELLQVPASLSEACPEAYADPEALARKVELGDKKRCTSTEENEVEGGDEFGALDGDCYFPKDGYNYDQHLKRMSGGKAGGVVGVVLEAPHKVPADQLNLQPAETAEEAEVLRALEFAEEYEELGDEILEDILPGGVVEPGSVLWGPAAAQDANLPDLALFKAAHAARLGALLGGEGAGPEGDREDGEGGEAGGGAGRCSADAGRGAAAVQVAADFEDFFAAEYGEDDAIGACDDEEIEGPVSLERCEGVLDEYLAGRTHEHEKLHSLYEPQKGSLDDVPRVIEETKAIIERHYSKDLEDGSDTSSGEESPDESRTWDCESVLSTLSNLSNRPGRIGRIKVIKKPAPAMKSVKELGDGTDDVGDDIEAVDVVELPDVVTERPRDETPDERRLRKAAVKEMRRICRKMKKESKDTYKAEAAKLSGKQGSADIRQGARCLRL